MPRYAGDRLLMVSGQRDVFSSLPACRRLRAAFVASLALAATPTHATGWYFGVWLGEARETGSDVPYSVALSIFQKDQQVFQHTRYGAPLDCSGGGRVISQDDFAMHLSEYITTNRAQCADGTVRIYSDGPEGLIWEWFYPDGTFAARANLTKQPD